MHIRMALVILIIQLGSFVVAMRWLCVEVRSGGFHIIQHALERASSTTFKVQLPYLSNSSVRIPRQSARVLHDLSPRVH
jgi:hypothetical protein